MRADELRDLKRKYLNLVRMHGEEATEFKAFKRALLDLNKRQRLEARMMFVRIIAKIERSLAKSARKKGR